MVIVDKITPDQTTKISRYLIRDNALIQLGNDILIPRSEGTKKEEVLGIKDNLAYVYSVVETAKANGLTPYDYISHCLNELCKPSPNIDSLLPWHINR